MTTRPCPMPTSARRSPRTTSRSASSSRTSSGTASSPRALRRRGGAAGDQRLLGGRGAALAAHAPPCGPGPLRRGHHRLRVPGMKPARARPRQHGAPPWRRQPRHVPRRPVGARHEVDRSARQRGSEGRWLPAMASLDAIGAFALTEPARLRLGRARDDRSPQWRRSGCWTAPSAGSATAPSPTSSSSGPLGRGRSGQGLPGRDRRRGSRARR